MPINADRPDRWKDDIAHSVDLYNEWFLTFAPKTYRERRKETTEHVAAALRRTGNLRTLTPDVLATNPSILPMLRMVTAPPLARDRLIGLAGLSKSLVQTMEEDGRVPPRMPQAQVQESLTRICATIEKLTDTDLFSWLAPIRSPNLNELARAATVVADRLCGAIADPIIRNAQEQRQLTKIKEWLTRRGYKYLPAGARAKFGEMPAGTFAFRLNVPVTLASNERHVNIPVDVAVIPKKGSTPITPLLIEAKSAGDFTNVNKRRKEEAMKMSQLRSTHGARVRYILFLCGYFDTGYLGYEAAEGIDWAWEHRIDDLAAFGL